MTTIKNRLKLKFIKHGSEPGIVILYGQGKEFWSCKRGTDLSDFDALLEYFIPNIDFELITPSIARWWEQELYRMFLQHEYRKSRMKIFKKFCERIGKRYRKKRITNLTKKTTENLLSQVEKATRDRMEFIKRNFAISRGKTGLVVAG